MIAMDSGQHKCSGTPPSDAGAATGSLGATAATTRSASAVERPTSTRSSNAKIGNVVASICSRAKSTARRPIEPPRRLHRSTPRFGASGSLGHGCTGYVRLRTRPSEGTSPPPPRRRQRAPPKRKTPIASLGAFLRAATVLRQSIDDYQSTCNPHAPTQALCRVSRARPGFLVSLHHARSSCRACAAASRTAAHNHDRRRAGLRDDAAQPPRGAAADPGANTSGPQQAP